MGGAFVGGAEGVTAIERPSWSANQIVAHGSEVRVPDPREVLSSLQVLIVVLPCSQHGPGTV